MEDSRLEACKASKVSGVNRDARLAGDDVTPTGCRALGFREGISRYRELDLKAFPFRGPRLAQEFMMSMYEANMKFIQRQINGQMAAVVSKPTDSTPRLDGLGYDSPSLLPQHA